MHSAELSFVLREDRMIVALDSWTSHELLLQEDGQNIVPGRRQDACAPHSRQHDR